MSKTENSLARLKAEYPELTAGHIRLMKFYSNPALAGPRISPELAALVRHLFTDEEAEVAQHLQIGRGRDARSLRAPGLAAERVSAACTNTPKRVLFRPSS